MNSFFLWYEVCHINLWTTEYNYKEMIKILMHPCKKKSNIKSQVFEHKTRLFIAINYPNFLRNEQALLDLQPKQTLRPTDRQTLNPYIAMKLTIAPQ